MESLKKRLHLIELNPAQILVLGFAVLILVGAILFMQPISTKEGQGLNFIDALFESTSAVCVTGLAVVDTGTTFTLFGQIVLLSLIQIGGWGFMTTGVFMFIILGKEIGLRERLLLQNSMNSPRSKLRGILSSLIASLTFCHLLTLLA